MGPVPVQAAIYFVLGRDDLFGSRKLTPNRIITLTAKPMRSKSYLRGMAGLGIFRNKHTTPPHTWAASTRYQQRNVFFVKLATSQ